MTVRRLTARLLAGALVAPLLPALVASPAAAAVPPFVPGTVEVVAGAGDGDGGPGPNAKLDLNVPAIGHAADGDLLAAGKTVRRVDAATGIVTTVATVTPSRGRIHDVAGAPDGSVYYADDQYVRRIAPDGTASIVAGGGSWPPPADPGPRDLVLRPRHLAVAPDGTVAVLSLDYVPTSQAADPYEPMIWRLSGDTATKVIAGESGHAIDGVPARDFWLRYVGELAFTPGGDLLVVDEYYRRIVRIPGGQPDGMVDTVGGKVGSGTVQDGSLATDGGLQVTDLATAPDGTVYVGTSHAGVRRFPIGGHITTVDDGGRSCGHLVSVGPDGTVAAYCSGAFATIAALPGDGTAVPVLGGDRAADGTPAAESWFAEPLRDVATGPDGTRYLVAGATDLRTLTPGGLLGTAATGLTGARAVAAARTGEVYVADGAVIRKVAGGTATAYAGTDGGVPPAAGLDAGTVTFGTIDGLAADGLGNVYVAVRQDCTVWRIDAGGVVHAVPVPGCPGSGQWAGGIAVTPDDRLVATHGGRLYAATAGGPFEAVDTGWGGPVTSTADGTVHGLGAALAPDGTRATQSYVLPWLWTLGAVRLAGGPDGTLAAVHPSSAEVLRLTPGTQQVPAAPAGLAVAAGPGTLALTWAPPASTDFTGYVVRVAPGTTPPLFGEGVEAGRAEPDATSFVVRTGHPAEPTGLRGGEPYAVSVWAYAPGGRSARAVATGVPEADETAPAAPLGVTVEYDAVAGRVRAEVTPALPFPPDFAGLHVRLADGATPPATPTDGRAPDSGSANLSAWDVGPDDGTYAVAAWAYDVYGNVSERVTGTVVVDRTPPAPVTGLALAVVGDEVVATWDAPAADVAYLRADDHTGEQDGRRLPVGQQSVSWPLRWGWNYFLRLRAYDAHHNASAPVLATLSPRRAGALSLTASAGTVTYGTRVTLRGRLTDPATGAGYGGEQVQLWRRLRGQTAYALLRTTTTAADGTAAFGLVPEADAAYELRHPDSVVAAVASPRRIVWVRAKVTAALSAASITLGRTAYVTGTIAPRHVGVPLTLQRWVTGLGWRSVATRESSVYSRARFPVGPGRGTYRYRVVFAGDAHHQPGASPAVTLRVT